MLTGDDTGRRYRVALAWMRSRPATGSRRRRPGLPNPSAYEGGRRGTDIVHDEVLSVLDVANWMSLTMTSNDAG